MPPLRSSLIGSEAMLQKFRRRFHSLMGAAAAGAHPRGDQWINRVPRTGGELYDNMLRPPEIPDDPRVAQWERAAREEMRTRRAGLSLPMRSALLRMGEEEEERRRREALDLDTDGEDEEEAEGARCGGRAQARLRPAEEELGLRRSPLRRGGMLAGGPMCLPPGRSPRYERRAVYGGRGAARGTEQAVAGGGGKRKARQEPEAASLPPGPAKKAKGPGGKAAAVASGRPVARPEPERRSLRGRR